MNDICAVQNNISYACHTVGIQIYFWIRVCFFPLKKTSRFSTPWWKVKSCRQIGTLEHGFKMRWPVVGLLGDSEKQGPCGGLLVAGFGLVWRTLCLLSTCFLSSLKNRDSKGLELPETSLVKPQATRSSSPGYNSSMSESDFKPLWRRMELNAHGSRAWPCLKHCWSYFWVNLG